MYYADKIKEVNGKGKVEMDWLEVRKFFPNQIVLIEALETNIIGTTRKILDMSVISIHEDSSAAWREYKKIHRKDRQREFYIFHTSRENIDVIEEKVRGKSVSSISNRKNATKFIQSNKTKEHEEVWEDIQNLSNREQIKLFEKLFYKFFDNSTSEEIIKREDKIEIWDERE